MFDAQGGVAQCACISQWVVDRPRRTDLADMGVEELRKDRSHVRPGEEFLAGDDMIDS